jgi:hypothetical protein
VTNCKYGFALIGCVCKTYDEWLSERDELADKYNFTSEEANEYIIYIKLMKDIGK